ncbi:hypothetical protein LR013_00865 [candidate division NPL-UPA2 bacterium]|nr:hypothetical protein [candidate division NPL-UPA2 bacterium]
MLWCTSHYKSGFAKKKAKELRKSGEFKKVWLGSYLKEYDSRTGQEETFCKIYVEEDSL